MSRVHAVDSLLFYLSFLPVLEFPFCLCRLEVSLGSSDVYWKRWNLMVHVSCSSVGVCYCARAFEDRFSKGKGNLRSCTEMRDNLFCT